MSVPDEALAAIALPSSNAFEALLRFVMTTTQVRRGTLSAGDSSKASIKAQIGFHDGKTAKAFAASADAELTDIPLVRPGLLKAVVALERRLGAAPLELPASMIELLSSQIRALLEAESLALDLGAFRRNINSIIDQAGEPFISMDGDGIVREWNEAATSTFGWSRAEALGKTTAELIVPPGLRERHLCSLNQYRQSAHSNVARQRVTMPAIRRDGSSLIVEMRISCSVGGDGELMFHSFVHDVTELEETRVRLSRSENLLCQAQQIVAIGSYEHDLVTDELFCSDELHRMLGTDPRDCSVDDLRALVHPDDLAAVRAEYRLAISERRPHDFESRALRRDGEIITLRQRGYTVTDDDGVPIRLFGTVQDVTEQRRGQAESRDLESRFAEAFDNAPVGMSIINGKPAEFGKFTRVNRAYCSLLGYSQDEIVGKFFTFFIAPEDRSDSLETTRDLVAGQADVTGRELRMIRRDGTRIWVRQTGSLMRDADGKALYFFTHTEDVTQRRADQAALAEVNARLQRSLDDAPIGMALTSADPASLGKLIEVNPALCRITGYPRSALIGKFCAELVHPEGRSRTMELMRKLVAREETICTFEERHLRADGSCGWVSVHASIAYDSADRPMYCIKQIVDITKRKQAESKLEHLAYHDALTGILNRRGLLLDVRRRFIDGDPVRAQTALLLLDLDHFKYVNDTIGHAAGDRILRKVAKILRRTCPHDATIGRLGGDEFLVLFADCDETAAVSAAGDIRRAIRSRIYLSNEGDLRATASIGIVMIDAWTLRTFDEAIAAADVALASAKAQGGDRSSVARSLISSHSAMREQLTWSQRIRSALECNEFVLYAQPILNLRTGFIERYELLLRMIDADGSVRLPGEFLPVAERTGLMPEIDRWVINNAIDIAALQQRTGRKVVFEVNLSGASLTNERVAACIEQGLRSTALDPRALVFEITETAAIENMEQACNFAEKISALGCAFALDDFGAGFSSFYYLKYLPFSDLKVDGEFIRNLTRSVSDQHIVRAIVELARGLGKATIAEHVDDAETAVLLQNYGVDFAQGYNIAKPLPWAATLKVARSAHF